MTTPTGRSEFSVVHSRTGAGTVVRLSGTVDEHFDPARAFGGIEGVAVFDLRNVGRITSFGVREWVRGLKACGASAYFFVNCRPALMAQFNMVPNFGGTGFVLSFFSPYRCAACGEETERLVDVRAQFDNVRQGIAPPEKCPKCQGTQELDDLPEVFFAYFAQAQAPVLPPAVAALVDLANLGASAAAPLRAVKQVDGDVTGIWLTGRLDARASVKRVVADLEGYVVFVFSGVEGCDAAGLDHLARFTLAPGKTARFFLARVPPTVIEALSTAPSPVARAAVVSIEVPFTCAKCGAASRDEVDAADIGGLAVSVRRVEPARVCAACGGPLVPQLAPAILGELAQMPIALAPPAVRTFLDRYRTAPSATPAAGVTLAGLSAPAGGAATRRFGEYEIIRPLGAGGMAEIYLARLVGPEGFTKTLVLKKIIPGLAVNQEFLQMFLAEARLAARISHPNVVQIFQLGVEAGRYFIVMEYVPGWNLNTVLATAHRRSTPMPTGVACRVVADVCGGLAAAHSLVDDQGRPMSVVHRDVSPHNVLISPAGAVKLTDFGIAKAAGHLEQTQPGVVKGKVAYLSPEQIEGREIDARSDVFAAGVLLYECLACRQLFRRANDADTFRAIQAGEVPPLSVARPEVPPALEAVVTRALARDREQRFQSAAQMQRAIEQFLAGTGRPATPADIAAYANALMESTGAGAAVRPPGAEKIESTTDVDVSTRPTSPSRTPAK